MNMDDEYAALLHVYHRLGEVEDAYIRKTKAAMLRRFESLNVPRVDIGSLDEEGTPKLLSVKSRHDGRRYIPLTIRYIGGDICIEGRMLSYYVSETEPVSLRRLRKMERAEIPYQELSPRSVARIFKAFIDAVEEHVPDEDWMDVD